jgi:hypothetical protein
MSIKFKGKYYIILNLYNGYLENNIVAFKVEVNQENTLNRYLLKLYKGNVALIDDASTWWMVNGFPKSFFLEKEYYKKYGLFPIEVSEFLSLINSFTKEVDKKELVKLLLKNEKNI